MRDDPDRRPPPVAAGGTGAEPAPLIDWSRTARRVRLLLVTILSAAVVLWFVLGLLGDGRSLPLLAELLGLGLLMSFVVEAVVVGGVAVRGMFAAGARGDRLASADVFLLPPQLLRGRGRTPDDPV